MKKTLTAALVAGIALVGIAATDAQASGGKIYQITAKPASGGKIYAAKTTTTVPSDLGHRRYWPLTSAVYVPAGKNSRTGAI